MSDDGRTGDARPRLARGTSPRPVARQPAAALGGPSAEGGAERPSEEPARSIHEAVERLLDAVEADDAIAEWTHGRC